jgi:hypothetical protein
MNKNIRVTILKKIIYYIKTKFNFFNAPFTVRMMQDVWTGLTEN